MRLPDLPLRRYERIGVHAVLENWTGLTGIPNAVEL
jgi:hypothetical protein